VHKPGIGKCFSSISLIISGFWMNGSLPSSFPFVILASYIRSAYWFLPEANKGSTGFC